jgi:glutamate synthase domain-containing protein 3
MMRHCHKNTCPVGVATQDPRLRKRFSGKPEYLINYFRFISQDLREIMAEMGFKTVDEMVGRADMLCKKENITHWKAKTLDFSRIFNYPEEAKKFQIRNTETQDHDIDDIPDRDLIKKAKGVIDGKKKSVKIDFDIKNIHRSFGVMLSGQIAKAKGKEGLADDSITVNLKGSAGQSFGAFAAKGLTLNIEGDCNDYVGKGLSGGKIIVRKPKESTFVERENVIAGNVLLYGATSGEAYLAGKVGERFCIRNSGATAVVEGVGDHGCEYMTGGVAVILGPTGVNFAAGMSGGIAFVYDAEQKFDLRCNLDMVDLEPIVEDEDEKLLKQLIENHVKYTGSEFGKNILDRWDEYITLFVKVMPIEYRRALGQMAEDANSRKTKEEVVQDG